MPHVLEVNRWEDLSEHHLLWRLQLGQTRGGSFFQSLEWLQNYGRHFGEDQRLRVLFVSSGGSPIGIVPLIVRREPTRVGALRVLTYPLHDWATRFGPLGANPTATMVAACKHIRDTPRDWDIFDLRWVDPNDGGRTSLALQQAGFPAARRVWKTTAVLDLRGGWAKYFASRTSKFRNNLRRQEKKLAAAGGVQFERFRPAGSVLSDDEPRWDLLEDCLAIAERSWQGSSTTGTTISHPDVRAFLSDCHEAAVRAGSLDIALLRLGGRPVAFAYNYVSDGRLFGLRTGYDPEFAKCGVGGVLWARTFEDSCERGDVEFDLGPDSPEVKRGWITESRAVMHYPFYSRAPRAQLVRLKHWLATPHSPRESATA